jgi:putative transposase
MPCPHCQSKTTSQRVKKTQLGYRTFCCRTCKRTFNERTSTPYNYLEFPTDIVMLVVLWRVRYKLSLRDLAEMFLQRGFAFTHEAVRAWEERFAPLVADKLRAKRKGQAGRSWHVDETYIRVGGVWKYLYRAIDREGNLVDSLLSEHRDMEAAKRFFTAALEVAEQPPEKVTTDGHDAYPRAIRETLGEAVSHRCNLYLNNRIEQDHRGVKQRYYPMRGFGSFDAASRFCRAFDEQRQYFRLRPGMCQPLSPLSEQRREFHVRWKELMGELMAA